jgi:hypothetical protein
MTQGQETTDRAEEDETDEKHGWDSLLVNAHVPGRPVDYGKWLKGLD